MSNSENTLKKCQTLAKQGKRAALIDALDQAVKDFPTLPDFTAMRAQLMIQTGNLNQARQDLEKTIQLNPFDSQSFDYLGVIEQMDGNYLRASELHISALNGQPHNPDFLFNLSAALGHLGQAKQATALYRSILEIAPTHIKTMINLADQLEKQQQNDEALRLLTKALSLDPNNFQACMGLGNLYRKLEQFDKAKTQYQKAVSLKPSHGAAQFMLANVTGTTPENAPLDYVTTLFDDFAEGFEDKLVGELEYRAPILIYDAVKQDLNTLKEKYNSLKAVDLGAGTGLFGKLIRDAITLSIGVDLSQKMLNKAQERQIYDEVICDDLHRALLSQNDQSCHLISAADVFVYVGALKGIFKETARVLVKDGVFAFTVESLPAQQSDDFKLLETARYAHHDRYIKTLAKQFGLTVTHEDQTWLRMNKKTPINGVVYVMSKSSP